MSAAALQRTGLFASLPAGELDELAASLRRRHYARGQVLFTERDPGATLFVVESGRVNMLLSSADGREIVVNSLGPGESFGEMALLTGEPRSTDAVVVEPGYLLQLDREDFVRCLRARPDLALAVMANLARRLRRTTQQVYDVAFLDVPARLARRLLDLAASDGEAAGDGAVRIARKLTQSELAGLIGATRESVNKWLSHYQRQGLVRVDGRTITLLAPEVLRRRIY
ncbi:MAG TPA: Crp/Fnr family transcriptional regulator [Chloroflexota bacterium]|nr:Crp/Fnr family transcriptional regulator [Chloroflexota bacterium]